MQYYKLTNQKMRTYRDFQWELGIWYSIDEIFRVPGEELCSRSWFHCTTSKELAIFLNPVQACIQEPRLFSVEALGMCRTDHGMKLGFTHMKLVKELDVPAITTTHRLAFGLLCAMEVYKEKSWQQWAKAWLGGSDRSRASASFTRDYYLSSRKVASNMAALYAADSAGNITKAVIAAASGVNVDREAAYAALDASHLDIDLIKPARKAMQVV